MNVKNEISFCQESISTLFSELVSNLCTLLCILWFYFYLCLWNLTIHFSYAGSDLQSLFSNVHFCHLLFRCIPQCSTICIFSYNPYSLADSNLSFHWFCLLLHPINCSAFYFMFHCKDIFTFSFWLIFRVWCSHLSWGWDWMANGRAPDGCTHWRCELFVSSKVAYPASEGLDGEDAIVDMISAVESLVVWKHCSSENRNAIIANSQICLNYDYLGGLLQYFPNFPSVFRFLPKVSHSS